MAKKKKKSTKTGKVTQVEKRRDIILFQSASEPVRVPDILYLVKKRFQGTRDLFVDSGSIQEEVSLPMASGSFESNKGEVVRCKRTKSKVGVAVFVPASCITDTTTPVIHFIYSNSSATKKISKKKKIDNHSEFVPTSCITQQVSLPHINEQINKPEKPIVAQTVVHDYHIFLENAKSRKKRKQSTVFVPSSCITGSTAMVYHFPKDVKPAVFINPYPDTPSLSPEIVSEIKVGRPKQKSQKVFIPASCITLAVSQPFQKPEPKPIIKYTYVDRPNTPDILGPTAKSNKRKPSKVVSFVPKSCTVEPTRQVSESLILQRTDALTRTEPKHDLEKKTSSNWLPLIALLALIAVVVGYVLQK